MKQSPATLARFTAVKNSPGRIAYYVNIPVGRQLPLLASVYGLCSTAEIFVELTDGIHTWVESFTSRHKCFPLEKRNADLPLVDLADAFALIRKITGHWPWRKARRGYPTRPPTDIAPAPRLAK